MTIKLLQVNCDGETKALKLSVCWLKFKIASQLWFLQIGIPFFEVLLALNKLSIYTFELMLICNYV